MGLIAHIDEQTSLLQRAKRDGLYLDTMSRKLETRNPKSEFMPQALYTGKGQRLSP